MLRCMRLAPGCGRPTACLGASCMAYLRLRKHSLVMPPPPAGQEGLLGLWHNSLFAGPCGGTLASRAAIKQGFLRWCDGARGDYLTADFPAVLKLAHLHHFANSMATVVSAHSGLSSWRAQASCDLVGWATAWFAQRMLLASSRQVILRTSGMTCLELKVFCRLWVPGFYYDFVCKAV